MKVKLFNKDFMVKDHHCNFNDAPGQKVDKPYINLYVRLTEECNAQCPYCEFHMNRNIIFDKFKFLYTIARLNKDVKINKISFTGGEPTLRIDLLNMFLKEVKEIVPEIYTVVNTNGFNFTQINEKYIDSIALSRHHYNNLQNDSLFRTTSIPTSEDILKYPHKEKLHLSCNLIEGYIDSVEQCHKYIDYFGNMGITDIGFVSLMGVNKFAEDHFIDFSKIDLGSMPNTIQSKTWAKKCKNKTVCKCANFLTSTDNGNIVKSYARYYVDRTECKGILVYEPDGRLTNGFGGEVINEC